MVTADGEASDLGGALSEGAAGKSVDVKGPLSTNGRQLDEVTHCGV